MNLPFFPLLPEPVLKNLLIANSIVLIIFLIIMELGYPTEEGGTERARVKLFYPAVMVMMVIVVIAGYMQFAPGNKW